MEGVVFALLSERRAYEIAWWRRPGCSVVFGGGVIADGSKREVIFEERLTKRGGIGIVVFVPQVLLVEVM